MPRKKIGSTLTTGFVIASLAVSLGAVSAAAASRDRHAAVATHRVHRAYAVHHRHHYVRSGFASPYAYAGPGQYVPRAGDALIYGPGYVFVPGHGILGESCDMPTSTCTNEYRDVQ